MCHIVSVLPTFKARLDKMDKLRYTRVDFLWINPLSPRSAYSIIDFSVRPHKKVEKKVKTTAAAPNAAK